MSIYKSENVFAPTFTQGEFYWEQNVPAQFDSAAGVTNVLVDVWDYDQNGQVVNAEQIVYSYSSSSLLNETQLHDLLIEEPEFKNSTGPLGSGGGIINPF